jgi:hypothetical protein
MKSLPPTSGIAWIPSLDDDLTAKNPEFLLYLNDKNVILRNLRLSVFKLGNPEPSLHVFRDRRSFIQYLRAKEYRAAIGLWEVTIPEEPSMARTPKAILLEDRLAIGYTPYHRFGIPFLKIPLKGEGWSDWSDIESTHPDVYVFGRYVVFRIGKIGKYIPRLISGKWPPYLRLAVTYEYNFASKQLDIHCTATYMPNHACATHKDGSEKLIYKHDMFTADVSRLIDVFESRDGQFADSRHFATYSVSV